MFKKHLVYELAYISTLISPDMRNSILAENVGEVLSKN